MDPAKILSFSCPDDQTFTCYLDDRASIQATVVSTLVAIPATISLNVWLIIAVIREKLPQNHTFILLGSMAIADLIISPLSMPAITVAMAVVHVSSSLFHENYLQIRLHQLNYIIFC